MIFESQAPVELMSTRVEVISLKMHSFDPDLSASLDGESDGCFPNSLLTPLWPHIELVYETVASMKLQRETEAEDHVTDQFFGVLEEDQSAEFSILDQFR